MKKWILIAMVSLLLMFAVTPVMAAPATKIPVTAEVEFGLGNISLGKQWVADGVNHVKGAISEGPFATTSGPEISGTWRFVTDIAIDLTTGLGHHHGKIVITVEGAGTFEGSARGTNMLIIIPDPPSFKDVVTGSFVLHGTGDFEGQKMMCSYEGEGVPGAGVIADVELKIEGIILSPKG